MKKLFTLVTILFIISNLNAQLQYSKVKIFATDIQLSQLSNIGITLDHGQHKSNNWFITDLSTLEIELLKNNHVPFEVLIEDVATFYADRNANLTESNNYRDRADCPSFGTSTFSPEVPENFNLGDMGGYFTYEEFLAELDLMHSLYPTIISEKAPIGTFETWEGRPIHWLRISDNASSDEDEKEVLYTAIHHAREPMSLSQTIFYMWYLLENYGTNAEITYLVDHTEMYFVPMINPDGYKYNHTTNPGGGGMHRKNRNPSIGTSNKGVDLNRNYSYHWNESGTSPYENGDTYAGLSDFSEPETQAIKWFCQNHSFDFAFNAHSHGDLILFPMGWATGAFAADHDYFQDYGNHMTTFNNYIAQKSSALYPAAGDSDDWMYADDLDTKPEIFAMTPEIGSDFWPASDEIIPTCQEMVWSNLILAHMPHVYGVCKDLEPSKINLSTGYLNYELQRLGLEDGAIEVSITPLVGILSVGEANNHDLVISEVITDSIAYELVPGIAFGEEIKYILHTNNGLWVRNDTLTKTYGSGTEVFFDDCSDLTSWIGDWDLTNETFYSSTSCITDSPYDGTYGNNVNKSIELVESVNLNDATYAYASFWAKWEIENDYDFVQFMISSDGGSTWTPLCGKYTNTGVAAQDPGNPLYDGNQNDWVFEEIDLSDYLGQENLRLKFRLITDGGLQMDGFYFDDFSVYTDGSSEIDDSNIADNELINFEIFPNPTNDVLNLRFSNNIEIQEVQILNELGAIVLHANISNEQIHLVTSQLAEGIYFLKVISLDGQESTKRFTIIR